MVEEPGSGPWTSWARGTVTSLGAGWPGAQELDVALDAGGAVRALCYPLLTGAPERGDAVLLSTAALQLGLGTGGYALVVALPDRLPATAAARAAGGRAQGHLVKARYTPSQVVVLGADEQGSPHHEVLREADDLAGMPVVVADLHSALPAVLAGVRQRRPDARVVHVMTDGGALPAWFSRTAAALRATGWLAGTVTTGQAFGGDVEAVTVHTGLLAARAVLRADVAVVVQGPGNLGTGTRWGFSGVAAGEAVNAAGVLGGRPVAALRISGADARERHRGVSHHSTTAYGRVALLPADVVVPDLAGLGTDELGTDGLGTDELGTDELVVHELVIARALAQRVLEQAAALGAPAGIHRLVTVGLEGLTTALRSVESATGARLSTMGRGLDADPAAFLASAAAGRHAADLLIPTA